MAAASRSSSAAPRRSEHRTRSTSHRPGAICASDVTLGTGGGGASGGGVGGVATCSGGEAGGFARAPTQHASTTATAYLFIAAPVYSGNSITGARTAGRTPSYGSAKGAEAGSDCSAAPGIARDRADKGAPGRASNGALKGTGGNGLARRRGIPITRRGWVILSAGNHRDIDGYQRCGRQQKDVESSHFGAPRVATRARLRVSGAGFAQQRASSARAVKRPPG